MTAPVVDNVLSLIGNTPLVRLRRVVPEGAAAVWAKCEQLNPGGSVKDRIALAMIEAAERDGRLKPGDTVVEPTSGNTGIGLALVCARKGYKLVLTMPESMSLERRALLEAYGVEIVLTAAERVMEGAIEAAQEILAERKAFMPSQFDNPENPNAHRRQTAQEILAALEGEPLHALVAAVGTGGTVSGVGEELKAKHPSLKVIAVEPEASPVLAGGEPGPTKIQGIGAGFVPGNFHHQVVDEIRQVADRDAYEMKIRLAKEEGLLVGISAGANVRVAAQLAKELGPGKTVVTVLCDTGERYFSLDEYFK
ncbi:MAG: cysteine synthase A [Myxococcales bacterium]